MRLAAVAALLAVTTTVASAQPGQTAPYPPAQPQPYPAPPPQPVQPQPYVPPPHAYYPPPAPLTPDEAKALEQGEISPGAQIGGTFIGFVLGFGSGQAVQGRWSERGWIFTVGEAASLVMLFASIDAWDDCAGDTCGGGPNGQFIIAYFAWVGFRIWGTLDAAIAPIGHNRKVRRAHLKAYGRPYYGAVPYLAPAAHGDGATAGFTLRF